jgi:hypothetical protein
MSKRGSATAVLAGAAIFALAGCGGAPKGAAPDVPGEMTASTASGTASAASGTASAASGTASAASGAASAASGAARVPGARHSAKSATGAGTGTGRGTESGSFVKADSIPFPVAVGNTWVYKTTLGAEVGRTTNRIVSAGPGQDGYEVTMSSATDLPGTTAAAQPVYVFYPDGTIGYPVPAVNGMPVAGVVRWPDAAGLASGRAYHSVLRVQAGQGGTADVTVQGEGTTPVSVPAGTFQASVVTMTIATRAGTVEVTTWIAQGIGPVKTMALVRAAGKTELLTASELRSFTRGAAVGIGS